MKTEKSNGQILDNAFNKGFLLGREYLITKECLPKIYNCGFISFLEFSGGTAIEAIRGFCKGYGIDEDSFKQQHTIYKKLL
ncbi:MAG: hypothetical protein KA536_15720 [Saprospiraceae bacterium]|nr:hypothetical protein [Saprospiraceae bacterium]